MARRLRLHTGDRLIETMPKALGQRVPEALHRRLLELCDLVYEAGQPQRPTKADMLAALILAAPENPEMLIDMLQRYGRARVGDALLAPSEAEVVDFPERTSGPRRGRR